MHLLRTVSRACVCALLLCFAERISAQTPVPGTKDESRLLTVEGTVQVYPVGGSGWVSVQTNQLLNLGDRLRTGERSRATVRLSDLTVLRLNELTTLQIRPPEQAGRPSSLDFKAGSAYFLGREKPAQQEFRSPLTSGAIRGTEFNIAVAEDGRTAVTLIEGALTLSNQLGQVAMASGEQGVVETGKAPVKTPMLEAINIIQWCLYYPGVLDAQELELTTDERQALADSLAAYTSGDLLQAVARYPANRTPASDSERVYRAATLLSAGQVEQAEGALAGLQAKQDGTNRAVRLANSLREVISVVKNQPGPRVESPHLATEWLAESYYLQAHANLGAALAAAQSAVAQSPNFGFGWARVAELETSFGRLSKAEEALDRSLKLSPRNAQSFAVKGFIQLAQNRGGEAEAAFDQAISLDGGLGNAWLGRGLCRIRRGHAEEGRQDMQVAAVLEPQRAVLRSYLAKAFSNSADNARAKKEIALAQKLDPNDPTAWLYAALIEQQSNEVNPAVRDLENSQKLNDNQRLFRSKLLLDEDQAVRGANLANVYQDTGFYNWNKAVAVSDWSVREASRAVSYDYANSSAHQFLANSYDALRDPRQINLRYETPWQSELLVAHLLAPVDVGNLSEFSAQQAYARLFGGDHFGVSSDTEYLTHGDWWERASQYGIYGPVGYAADVEYRSERGWRVNNDLEQFSAAVRGKAELTPQDSILLEGIYYSATFGDELQYYNQYGTLTNSPAPSPTFRGFERQWATLDQPNLLFGYHHEWAPGLHTVFLGGHLTDQLGYTEPGRAVIPFTASAFGNFSVRTDYPFQVNYGRDLEAYTAELQQIWQTERQQFVAGGRFQTGWNNTSAQVTNGLTRAIITNQDFETDFQRYSLYAYETVKIFDPLQLTVGITYDYWHYPLNIDTAPITTSEGNIDQVSPKVGVIWSPWDSTHFRAAYTRSLGGVPGPDGSYRLEPTQVAGFNQAFRSIIPESVVGLVPATHFTTYGAGWDQSFKTQTYLSLQLEWLDSDANRTVGAFTNSTGFVPVPDTATSLDQHLDFTEKSLVFSLTQLLGDRWSVGARYQLTHAELNSQLTGIPLTAAGGLNQDVNATLHWVSIFGNYYHPCGFFAQAQAIWVGQDNNGYQPALAGDNFWQFNLYAGYRFLHRAAEARVGLLNVTDQDYLLNPLTLYYDLPRSRTVSLSLKFFF